METKTKIEVKHNQSEDEKKESDSIHTKSRLSTRQDPKVRMSYVVPEEIYPENIDI